MQDEILFGQECELEDEKGGICRVNTFYGYEGFAPSGAFLKNGKVSEEWKRAEKNVVSAPFAAVLGMPLSKSRLLANVPRASVMAPCGEKNGAFLRVVLPDGSHGYVEASQLRAFREPQGSAHGRALLCRDALSYSGCQYLWGGKTPMGLDCSGLVSVCCLMQGIIIYRDAKRAEGFAAKPVSFKNMQMGDILYFPGHMGIYLGKGKFVHSTGCEKTRGVCVASLVEGDEGYRADLKATILEAASVF